MRLVIVHRSDKNRVASCISTAQCLLALAIELVVGEVAHLVIREGVSEFRLFNSRVLVHADVPIVELLLEVAVEEGVRIDLTRTILFWSNRGGSLGGHYRRLGAFFNHGIPVDIAEERMFLYLGGATLAAKTLIR